MTLIVVAAVELLVFHMVDGRTVMVNPQQVTQVLSPTEDGNHILVETVQCVIRLTDGSYLSVAESCDEVRRAMEEKK